MVFNVFPITVRFPMALKGFSQSDCGPAVGGGEKRKESQRFPMAPQLDPRRPARCLLRALWPAPRAWCRKATFSNGFRRFPHNRKISAIVSAGARTFPYAAAQQTRTFIMVFYHGFLSWFFIMVF